MRNNTGIFIFISLLYLVGTVLAVGIPDSITVATNKDWIVADNVDQSIITVTVTNTTQGYAGAVQGVTINLAVDPQYGYLSSTSVTTDPYGMASGVFKVKTKSGAAQITATISSAALSNSTIQNIDHDSPYSSYFTYPPNGEVASEIPFHISITDRWGNPIDNRKGDHVISLHTHGPAPDDCKFVGYGHDISSALDPNGNISVNIKLSSKIGLNYILMDQFGSMPDHFEWIVAEATGEPVSINGTISDGGILPVDTTPFVIDYFLFDIYGNPVRNRSILVNTTPFNEQKKYTTNSFGRIRLYYGPMISASDITITAISLDNPNVMNTLVAHFINSEPTNMVLVATPQIMASREIAPEIKAFVRATVIDQWGNPVPNQYVSFEICDIEGINESMANGTPSFSPVSVVTTATTTTDSNGNAIVLFYPGSFAKRNEPGYSNMATASCTVAAQWDSEIRITKLTWKNYPFLSVNASASPQNIRLNDTFDVTIKVNGDGYEMPGAAVTAILDMDCTSNIFQNNDVPGPKRIDSAKAAAKAFVDEMVEGQDYVGLISFGTEANNQFHLPPQASMDLVNLKIDNLTRGTNARDFGASIYDSISNITWTQNNPPPGRPQDEVRAVIVLRDAGGGNINDDIDALIAPALNANPKIYIFTVYYYDGSSTTSNAEVIMRNLANKTGAQFFKPSNPEELRQAYISIAGILRTLAGVNATMKVNYQYFEVDSEKMVGKEVFDYVPVEMGETSPDSRTTILRSNNTRTFRNQTDEWNMNNYLHFDIGTLNISERWETTYRLKANQTGLIKLFDNTSMISFNNGVDFLEFPDLYIMVTPNVTPQTPLTGLEVWNLVVTKSGPIRDYLPLEWNLRYTGFNTTTETIRYQYNNNGPLIPLYIRANIAQGNYTHIATLDVKKLPPGTYSIYINASAIDALDDGDGPVIVNISNTGIYILLE
jgi:hypothetical protein